MRKLILGTAGHIDHGKTTLIRALTGVDTDRLAEEKRRGITIDLGFARLPLGDGSLELGIVDVPGHEGFVRNMLAGATGIDLVLLVVAADEGVMPQTREHLAIVDLLGVRGGVVAVTKTDLVEPEWLELVLEDLREELRSTPFARAPLVPVSAESGAGLDALREALHAAAEAVEERSASDLFRLPVDRVFTVHGTGTVVTGTIWHGRVARDQTVRAMPDGPEARIRGIQVHGRDVEAAEAGQRVAIALAGVEKEQLGRGRTLVADPAWRSERVITVRLRLLEGTDWTIRPRQRVRFHLGTAEVMARVALPAGTELGPGDFAWAQLRTEAPVVARAGDRFVVRSYSPVTTIGGGVVVEPAPERRRRLRDLVPERLEKIVLGAPEEAVAAHVALAGWRGSSVAALPVATPLSPRALAATLERLDGEAVVRAGDRIFPADLAARARTRFLDALEAYHALHPLRPGMDREELRRALPNAAAPELGEAVLARLFEEGEIVAQGGLVARAGFAPRLDAKQAALRDRILEALGAGGLAPPTLGELPAELVRHDDFRAILRLLEQAGTVVPLTQELYVTRDALERAIAAARRELAGREALGPTDFKEVFAVSRKFLIPLLEYLDRSGVTVRRGDQRILAGG